MTVKLYMDARANSAVCPVKIVVNHRGTALLSTGIKIEAQRWDAARSVVKNGDRKAAINQELQMKLDKVKAVAGYVVAHADHDMKATELKAEIVKVLGKQIQLNEQYQLLLDGSEVKEREAVDEGKLFLPYYKKHMARYKAGSSELYRKTLLWLEKYEPRLESLTFEDITVSWLRDFDDYLMPSSPSANSRSIHMRNIRAVINRAIDDDLTDNYPFRKFKIKQQDTEHRAMSLGELREFLAMPCESFQEKYRDMWWLSFLLWGINAADLYNLKKRDIKDGHIIYRRAKTGKLYDVAVEPEAMALIEKYQGEGEWLLCFHGTQRSVKAFRDKVNRGCQGIGRTEHYETAKGRFPEISTYWARHTWATLLGELDTPLETIALGLGHGKRSVTDIYIKPQLKKVQEANRRLIDYITKNDAADAASS